MERERFEGPLRIWPWPILNLLLSVLGGRQSSVSSSPRSVGSNSKLQVSVENIEDWEIIRDSRGRLSNIRVHRSVKE